MEQKIENTIDNFLEGFSTQLYVFSVGFGIGLVILGLIIFLFAKRSKVKSRKSTASLICMMIGIVAILSGLVQMF